MKFESEIDAREYLTAHICQSLPRPLASRISDGLFNQCAYKIETPVSYTGFAVIFPVVHWVIKDDDLKILDALIDGAKAAVISGFLLGAGTEAGTAAGTIGILAAVLKLGRQAVFKGVQLSPLHYAVLVTLQNFDGMMQDELIDKVDLYTGRKNDPTEVIKALDDLKAIAVTDGSVLSFVSQDFRGVWRAAGV